MLLVVPQKLKTTQQACRSNRLKGHSWDLLDDEGRATRSTSRCRDAFLLFFRTGCSAALGVPFVTKEFTSANQSWHRNANVFSVCHKRVACFVSQSQSQFHFFFLSLHFANILARPWQSVFCCTQWCRCLRPAHGGTVSLPFWNHKQMDLNTCEHINQRFGPRCEGTSPPIAMHYAGGGRVVAHFMGVAHHGGWHIPGGLTLVLTWLMAGRGVG